jgi:hypothetical protein
MNKNIGMTFSGQYIQLSQITMTSRQLFEDQVTIFQSYQFDLDEDDHSKIFPYFMIKKKAYAQQEIFNLKSQSEMISLLLRMDSSEQIISLKELFLEEDYSSEQQAVFDFMMDQILNSLHFHFFHKGENGIEQIMVNISLKYQHFIQKVKSKINQFKVDKNLNFGLLIVDDVDAYISHCLYYLERKQALLFVNTNLNTSHIDQGTHKKVGFTLSFNQDHMILSEYEILIQINAEKKLKYSKKRLKRMIINDHGYQKIDELLNQLILNEFQYQYEYFINRLSITQKNEVFNEIKRICAYYLLDIKKMIKSCLPSKDFDQKYLKLQMNIKNLLNLTDDFIFKFSLYQIEAIYQSFFQSLFDYLSLEQFNDLCNHDFLILVGDDFHLIDSKKILKNRMNQSKMLILDENDLKTKFYQPNLGCILNSLYENSSQFLSDALSEDFYLSLKPQASETINPISLEEIIQAESIPIVSIPIASMPTASIPVTPIQAVSIHNKSKLNHYLDLFVNQLEISTEDLELKMMLFKKHFKKIEWILQFHLEDATFLDKTIEQSIHLLQSLETLESFQQQHRIPPEINIKSVARPPQILLVDGDQLNAQQIVQLIKYAKDRIGPIVRGIVAKNSWPNLIDYISGIEYRMAHRGANVADHILISEARRMSEDLSNDVVFTIASNDSDLLKILQENRNRKYFWLPFTQAPEKLKDVLKYYQATLLPPFKQFEDQYKH